jgi:TatD DNase family protein
MKIFDSHAHMDAKQFNEDRDQLLADFPSLGVTGVMNASVSVENAKDVLALCESWPYLYGAVGIYPHETHKAKEGDLEALEGLAKHPKAVAIGEIGLDYYWKEAPKDVQMKWFVDQLRLAKRLDMPVNIHCRDAHGDMVDVLKAEQDGRLKGVLHSFSGSREVMEEYVKLGFYISLPGTVTFKNANRVKEVAAAIPLDRLLVETDAPYQTPEPFRGKRNDPAKVRFIIQEIARIRKMDPVEIGRITDENARRIYGIEES